MNIYSISENPSNGCFIVLSSLKSKYDKTFHLKVIDLNGRQLESLDSSIGSIVCLNELERGIYIVMISDPSSNVECHKIVIN